MGIRYYPMRFEVEGEEDLHIEMLSMDEFFSRTDDDGITTLEDGRKGTAAGDFRRFADIRKADAFGTWVSDNLAGAKHQQKDFLAAYARAGITNLSFNGKGQLVGHGRHDRLRCMMARGYMDAEGGCYEEKARKSRSE